MEVFSALICSDADSQKLLKWCSCHTTDEWRLRSALALLRKWENSEEDSQYSVQMNEGVLLACEAEKSFCCYRPVIDNLILGELA